MQDRDEDEREAGDSSWSIEGTRGEDEDEEEEERGAKKAVDVERARARVGRRRETAMGLRRRMRYYRNKTKKGAYGGEQIKRTLGKVERGRRGMGLRIAGGKGIPAGVERNEGRG